MSIIRYRVNDIIEMKKPHPCGANQFRILRVGSEMRVMCMGCGRDMNVDRLKLEKATKKMIFTEDDGTQSI